MNWTQVQLSRKKLRVLREKSRQVPLQLAIRNAQLLARFSRRFLRFRRWSDPVPNLSIRRLQPKLSHAVAKGGLCHPEEGRGSTLIPARTLQGLPDPPSLDILEPTLEVRRKGSF